MKNIKKYLVLLLLPCLVVVYYLSRFTPPIEHAQAAQCPCSLWAPSTIPGSANSSETRASEVGVKFKADMNGFITGVRFYKGSLNSGTHTGNLWDNNGNLLARAVFTNETASGWQQVSFASPVAVNANTVYVASYFAPAGRYALNANYFTSEYYNAPLRAPKSSAVGGNGVFKLTSSTAFPNSSSKSSNYWVDVVFVTTVAPDTTPPSVSSVTPAPGAQGVTNTDNVTATFSEAIDPATVNTSTFELRDTNNALVPAAVTYNATSKTATLDPTNALGTTATYTATIKGGSVDPRIKDTAGNALGSDYTWTFATATTNANAINEGPGGPILVISSNTNQFSKYYAEILRNEGYNNFAVNDIGAVNAATLGNYDVVILPQITLDAGQVTMLQDWVIGGGNLITMRPDKQLASFLGITDQNSTLSNGYLLIDTNSEAGKGLVNQTIQFHDSADKYSLNGATAIATLYSDATTSTANPAVTLKNVGSSGGQVAAFTYDLAKSVVWSRQGNPAWAGQERDNASPIRSNDMYTGLNGEANWIDLNKVAIPQADEQQRLLGNLITTMNKDKKPLPHFWYLKNGKKAAIVMTGDDHANGGTAGRFDQYKTASPANCSVENWECIRSTSYIYPNAPLTNTQAAAYTNDGFEVALHVNTGCADYTASSLTANFQTQRNDFGAKYTSIPLPVTNRTHCMPWSDWFTHPQVQKNFNVRFDTNYYYWPPAWSGSRPGFFTASGFPMRFANTDGTMIDVFQATTYMTDESGQSYPFTVDSLLDKAIGAEGYYGALTTNMHTDQVNSTGSDAIINSAKARNIPVISSKQMLDWLDGKNSSTINNLSWANNVLTFSTGVGAKAQGIQLMLPTTTPNATLQSISQGGNPVTYTVATIKGVEYAMFTVLTGDYTATYGVDATPPTVTSVSPTAGAQNVNTTANVTATFNESIDSSTVNSSTVELRDPSNTVISSAISYDGNTKTITINPTVNLANSTLYIVTLKGGTTDPVIRDTANNALTVDYTWSFTTNTATAYNCPCSIWSASSVPAVPAHSDNTASEVAVKFRSDVNGFITGVRFYKGTGNTGTHTGKIWTTSGQMLAKATFTNETATGWQQVNFATPVPVTANTTYIASYFTPTGHYASDTNYFTNAGVDNVPLHALKDGFDGANSVYSKAEDVFPTSTWFGTNYWVDVVFTQ